MKLEDLKKNVGTAGLELSDGEIVQPMACWFSCTKCSSSCQSGCSVAGTKGCKQSECAGACSGGCAHSCHNGSTIDFNIPIVIASQ